MDFMGCQQVDLQNIKSKFKLFILHFKKSLYLIYSLYHWNGSLYAHKWPFFVCLITSIALVDFAHKNFIILVFFLLERFFVMLNVMSVLQRVAPYDSWQMIKYFFCSQSNLNIDAVSMSLSNVTSNKEIDLKECFFLLRYFWWDLCW